MNSPDINFRNIRKHRNSQNDGFEELTRQLILADPPEGNSEIEHRGPGADGGVEVLARFPDGRVWGWQSKYFPDSFASSEIEQLKKSFRSALKNIEKLERYYVAIPRNLSGAAESSQNTQTKNWKSFVDWCETAATKQGQTVKVILWDETFFVSKLQLSDPIHTGMRHYWFNQKMLSADWFEQRLAESLEYIGKRYRREDHIELPISRPIRLLRRSDTLDEHISNLLKGLKDTLEELSRLTSYTKIDSDLKNKCSLLYAQIGKQYLKASSANHQSLLAPDISEVLAQLREIRTSGSFATIRDARYEQKEITDQKTGKKVRVFVHEEYVRHELGEFISKFSSASSQFSTTEAGLFNKPRLLVVGDAGMGKSHILAKEVESHLLEDKGPGLFIPARVLDQGDKPQKEILDFLDLSDMSFETFLGAFQAAALASQKPAFLVIDALNESQNARGWSAGLPRLLEQIRKFREIALCVSVRSSYQELCVRVGLDIETITHHGFRGHLGDAAKEYLDRNGIERPSAPIFGLTEILYNPLFLSTAVDYLKATNQTSFPRGVESMRTLIEFWLSAIEQNLIDDNFNRIFLGDGKINKVLQRLGDKMAETGNEFILHEHANEICENVLNLAPPATVRDRLLDRLIDEGVLLDFPELKSEHGKRVSFGFQKFSDYFFADAILRECSTKEELTESITDEGKFAYLFSSKRYRVFAGPRIALLALTPVRLGCELPFLEEKILENVQISISEYLSSISLRGGKDISAETVDLLEELRDPQGSEEPRISDEQWFSLLAEMAPLVDCPINASYLKEYLASMPLGERDATWSVFLTGKTHAYEDEWSSIHQIINWAWIGPTIPITPEALHQVATMLALMTSTMDRELRDCASKALASLMVKYPEAISRLIESFCNWDDPYVRERILAATAAGVLYCEDKEILKSAAISADEMVFKKSPVERHAWTRRYAQIIVNHADFNNAGIEKELLERSRPPYASLPIKHWPSIEEIAPYSKTASAIFGSVVGYISDPYDGKLPSMAGDFGRYTMGGVGSFSEEVRGDEPPLTREAMIEAFWSKVCALGSKFQKARADILAAEKLVSQDRFSLFLNILDDDSDELDQTEGNDGKQEAGSARDSLEKARETLLSLLPDHLKKEYDDLDPLKSYGERGIAKFPLSRAQYWVCNRALELGWDQELHQEIERNELSSSYGRYDHEIERIGKKYQHIAFGELTGYLADHHWYAEYSEKPRVLLEIEEFSRSDIDTTYLSGSYSKKIDYYLPAGIELPNLTFVPSSPRSNMQWAKTLSDIPDPTPYFIQGGDDGHQWCLQHGFRRSRNYMDGFKTTKPFRSAQIGFELILVRARDLENIDQITTQSIKQSNHDIFGNSWSTTPLFGQRTFRHLNGKQEFNLCYKMADIEFGRITEDFTAKYGSYDKSGIDEDRNFSTPHRAILYDLKLAPGGPWSNLFVAEDGTPAFADNPALLGGTCIIRHDLLKEFADKHSLALVWRVWVEKDGGRGNAYHDDGDRMFARHDFIGFYYQSGSSWKGQLIPFRD